MQQGLRIILCVIAMFLSPSLHAKSFLAQFKDDDGWFDVSDWVLDNAVGFMPVPITITEPAVDDGIGLAVLFFHPPKNYSKEQVNNAASADTDGFVLPDQYGAGLVEFKISTNPGFYYGFIDCLI